jgi:hypothetical protein
MCSKDVNRKKFAIMEKEMPLVMAFLQMQFPTSFFETPRAFVNSFGERSETSWTSRNSMDVFNKRYYKNIEGVC